MSTARFQSSEREEAGPGRLDAMMELGDRLARLNAQRRFDLLMRPSFVPEKAVAMWEHRGLACAICRGPMIGYNGYVQLPDEAQALYPHYDEIHVEAPGGLTWGMDGGGWIGFDTNHAWDIWPADTKNPEYEHDYDPCEIARTFHAADGNYWTYDRVRVWTMRLADQIAASRDWYWTEWTPTGVRTRLLPGGAR